MTTPYPAFGTFFLPGPTEVRPAILQAMLRPMIPHRGAEFEALFARIQAGLGLVFKTARLPLVSSSSATGLMEMAVRCSPPGPVLALVNGAFSERFAEIARSCGRDVTVLDTPWGAAADLDDVARALAVRRYAAVAVVHSETSTGVLTDVRAVSDVAHAHGAMCLVDSVTGVGGAPLDFDGWGLDFALTGSQKALALPPGLALGVASAEYVRRAAEAPARGRYFDVLEFEEYARKRQTPNTPALPLLYALDAQLADVAAETIEGRWARHAAMATRTAAWAAELGALGGRGTGSSGILAPEGARSPTVSAITLPPHVRGGDVVRAAAARGVTVGGGYGRLRDQTFRIGHMGDHTPETLERCLAACTAALDELLA